jgi:hypothetical protein
VQAAGEEQNEISNFRGTASIGAVRDAVEWAVPPAHFLAAGLFGPAFRWFLPYMGDDLGYRLDFLL